MRLDRTAKSAVWPGRIAVCLGIAVALLVLLAAGSALARVGGGEFFGGGGSGGDGGCDGDGELVFYLVWLAIDYPQVGVPLLVLVVIGWAFKRYLERKNRLPASTQQSYQRAVTGVAARRRAAVKARLQPLIADDPNFSEVLFLDFVQMIYARFMESRGSRDPEGLRHFLSETLFEELVALGRSRKRAGFEIEQVIVGSLQIEDVNEMGGAWVIGCVLEANYAERYRSSLESGEPQEEALYSRWRLVFDRARGVLSKGPEAIRSLGCPSCGSPIKLDAKNVCAYCGQAIRPGLFHWKLRAAEEMVRQRRIDMPMQLGGQEVGTGFPTIYDPDLDVARKSFQMRYPGESIGRLVARAQEVFLKLQDAWNRNKWELARPFETDRLYQTHLFWMERYKARGYRNAIEQVKVLGCELVKLDRDAFFEMASLRIRASMIDYTYGVDGNLLAGSRTDPRVFSEYWTFIRRAGFEPGKALDSSSCPSCGAAIKVAMNGRCEYCDAHLSSGDFDWTLARIEQDESYAG
ncbi:MAG: TIM44-like domain-containing protein [Deltaproteobacteria bacterium]|nr:TIM44-like domain-containing protein [Deltaproteobacteria bacterium]